MYIKKLTQFVALSILILVSQSGCAQKDEYKYEYLYKDLPFGMQKLDKPVFPSNQVSVADFGGVADGVTLNTEAFEKAMDALGKKVEEH